MSGKEEDKMRLKELDMHCGECDVVGLCGEPYSNICLCENEVIGELTEEERRCKSWLIKA